MHDPEKQFHSLFCCQNASYRKQYPTIIQQSVVSFFKNCWLNSKHDILYLRQKSYQNRSANNITNIMPSSWLIQRVFNTSLFQVVQFPFLLLECLTQQAVSHNYSAVKGEFLQKLPVQFPFLLLECLIQEAVSHNCFIQQSKVSFFKNSSLNFKHYILYLRQKSYWNRSANKTTKIMPSLSPVQRLFNTSLFHVWTSLLWLCSLEAVESYPYKNSIKFFETFFLIF